MKNEQKIKPLAKLGNIAVWPAKEIKTGVKIQTVSFDQCNGERQYVSIFPKMGNITLDAEQILNLCLKDQVTVNGESSYGPYTCTVVNKGIETSEQQKDGNTYKNHTMKTGLAFHKIDKNDNLFGYSCDGIGFYRSSEDTKTNKEMELDPKDCFKLLEGKSIFKNDKMASLKIFQTNNVGSKPEEKEEEATKYKTARLDIQENPYFGGVRQEVEHSNMVEGIGQKV